MIDISKRIEEEFQDYIKMVYDNKVGELQKQEIKKSFAGGIMTALSLLSEIVSDPDVKDEVDIMVNLQDKCLEWMKPQATFVVIRLGKKADN